ncbi:MAG TPA: acetoin utilization protein AcuC [Thermoplasmata archaeon]|nr:acetoin utilization protein AcuC [Thermoplasmata archaeon]
MLEYDFGPDHPFQMRYRGEAARALSGGAGPPVEPASDEVITRFHRPAYVEFVRAAASRSGRGLLDRGDTPSFPRCDRAAARVVAGTLAGLDAITRGESRRAFAPSGGLHHAHPDRASGFCIFNDVAVALASALRPTGPYDRVAYVDIDAHHGDGVMYGFYGDGRVLDLDFHQDGRTLFPGTGAAHETGSGDGAGQKVNFPLPPGSGDGTILPLFERVAGPMIREHRPQLIVLQHGVDGHAADPLAALEYSDGAYATILRRVLELAEEVGSAGVLVTGGGGYDREAVVRVLTTAGRILASVSRPPMESVVEEPWVDTTVRDLERALGRRFPAVG